MTLQTAAAKFALNAINKFISAEHLASVEIVDLHIAAGKLSDALEAEQAQAVEHKPRDRIADAGKTMGERDELIGRLSFTAAASAALRPMCIAAIDMLEADAIEMQATELQVEILSDELSKCSKQAQQVAVPVPMTDEQIDQLWMEVSSEYDKTAQGYESHNFARAIEKHHGIGVKQ